MGYVSEDARIIEANVDDGHSSSMYDAQFKPSSSNLPALGATLLQQANTNLLSTAYQNTTYDQFGRPTGAINPTMISVSSPTTIVQPKTTMPMLTPVAPVSIFPTGITPPTTLPAPLPNPNPGGIQIISPSAPATPATQQAAQDNANTLNQQSQQAAAAGNSALAKALAAQAQNWNSISNAIGSANGTVVNPLSSDSGVSASVDTAGSNTDSTLSTGATANVPPVVTAGLLGNIDPKYLLAAAAAALFLLTGKK